jgi:hypothetical protein
MSNISPETIKSICKSAAYGETAEVTAKCHQVSAEDVESIWANNPELIKDYKDNFEAIAGGDYNG